MFRHSFRWELWDSLPTMPVAAQHLDGRDPLSTDAGADGGAFMYLDGREA